MLICTRKKELDMGLVKSGQLLFVIVHIISVKFLLRSQRELQLVKLIY